MTQIPFTAFDADNHYYEAEDAFTRHPDPKLANRAVQWVEMNGKRRLLVAGRVNRFIANPTFDPIARPGCLDDYFRGRHKVEAIRDAFGDLEPIRPEYRDRDARLAVMDAQGLEAAFLFPTLGVGLEDVPRSRHRGSPAHLAGLQPLARRGLGVPLPGAHLRRPHDQPFRS